LPPEPALALPPDAVAVGARRALRLAGSPWAQALSPPVGVRAAEQDDSSQPADDSVVPPVHDSPVELELVPDG
jgi:hypothetical protein